MKTNSKHVTIRPIGKKADKKARMTIEKELTIYTVLEIKEHFMLALKEFKALNVHIQNVENLDLSFIQLIESLRKTAEEYGRQLTISAELKDETHNLVENAGFDPVLKT